jgi:2-polyprenyl-3-methyl-5-hydroxy-6-metoxy-1,4-benzoquinol methylase
MKKNNLKKFYQKIKTGQVKYFFGSKHIYKFLSKKFEKNFNKKNILELGCGDFSNFKILKKFKFKKYYAVDWIEFNKIHKLDKRINYIRSPILKFLNDNENNNIFDLIFTVGTLEHFTNPWKILIKIKKKIKKGGHLIICYPNYYNLRGLSLMTLKHLLNHRISLSDKYFFRPEEIQKKIKTFGFSNIKIQSIHQTGSYGDVAIKDLKQRLPKIFNKKKIYNLNSFIKFFKTYSEYYKENQYSGQIIVISAKYR